MERDIHFWYTTLIRGFIALIAGSAIIFIPEMAHTILLLPIAVGVAVVGLATYGVLDSTLIFISSFMAASRPARVALRIQGVVGASVGLLLLSIVFERVQLEWFLSLAAVQAFSLCVGEFIVARHERRRATSSWNYAASAIAFLFACAYVTVRVRYADGLTYADLSWLVYAYLVALGIAQALTAARMIYADYRPSVELPLRPVSRA